MLAFSESATDVRNKWSDFVNEVAIQQIPKVVSRNNKHSFMSISLEQLSTILHAYHFNVLIEEEDDGTFTVELDGFDLLANADTLDAALASLASDLIEYAHDYIKDFALYYNSPNRTSHLPYVLAVLTHDSLEDIIQLLNADIQRT